MGQREGPLEGLAVVPDRKFWKGKRVLVTGHTGFKGAWLTIWLASLGAKVSGYSLKPPTKPSLFELARLSAIAQTEIADIRELKRLENFINRVMPEIVFHLAAQPLVRDSYLDPVGTFSTNIMGTVNLLEAARHSRTVKAIVNVTSDKCYRNVAKDCSCSFREDDPLGGYDPYSSSKAGSELVTSAYRSSYSLNLASARAGNVIGGGDWAKDRLVPDFIKAILKGKQIIIRSPKAVRPWQHVLEPLSGYLLLAEKLYNCKGQYASAWNFGPDKKDAKPVEILVKMLCQKWGRGASYTIERKSQLHEAGYLVLDAGKAKQGLGWQPKWDLDIALDKVVEWTRAYQGKADLRQVCLEQIEEYSQDE